MILSNALLFAKEKLVPVSESPSLDAEILLSEAVGVSREFLFSRPNFRLSPEQIKTFGIFLQKRLLGFSVAVILGKKHFFGREFLVNDRVLVPRPETEILLEKMLAFLRNIPSGRIIDIGTGSGVLAISLFLEFGKKFEISAIDISQDALVVAQKNAERYGAKIHFFHSDFADFLENPISQKKDALGNFLIRNTFFSQNPLFFVANLPYVPESERHFSIKKEPDLAIFSGKDGLNAFRLFFEKLKKIRFEAVFFEFHPPQKEFFELFFQKNFPQYSADFFRDLSGDWRIGVLKCSDFVFV